MKVTYKLVTNSPCYEVNCDGVTVEVVFFATAKMRKDYPNLAARMNKDEARIYAAERAKFYAAKHA